jgi:hypothetical protein
MIRQGATTRLTAAATLRPGTGAEYRPGVCNIGPAEIARRRRAGHIGTAVAVGLLLLLVLIHAPAPLRLLVFLPAAGAASGYLQAIVRFCAGFGARGAFNFGEIGRTDGVTDPEARARDRAMAARIGVASALVGVVAAIVAVLLPV